MAVRTGVPLALTAVLLLFGAAVSLQGSGDRTAGPPGKVLEGRVLDETGRAIHGASVQVAPGVRVPSDRQGRFRASVSEEPRLISAAAAGHLPRTLAAEPGATTEIVLTSEAASTLSLRFGGDVMFGRRYYDTNEHADRTEARLRPGASVDEHAALLAHVKPLLTDADLTVVNLETPLLAKPWTVGGEAARPSTVHPTREFVFASAPESAQALFDSGVDAVSLGNDHVFDGLGAGLESTLTALDRAGVPHFGAGRTLDEAWAPALIKRKGQRLALLGCTTITGAAHPIPYVADEARAGAAHCTKGRLRRAVRSAREVSDVVVVMVHGGKKYQTRQTEFVRELSHTATEAGAALVVNGHPHVVGGLAVEESALVAETMGNLLFDQTIWPTFLSYMLRVDLRAGVPVHAAIDPLLIEGLVPRPTVGVLADAAARRAAGSRPGQFLLRSPGAVFAPARPDNPQRRRERLPPGTLGRLAPGWWVDTVPADDSVAVGEDLLWTGSFEDMDTDPATSGAHLWTFGKNVAHTGRAACSGAAGMELRRSPVSDEDVVLTPAHRQLVVAGTRVSLLAKVRGASPGSSLELALFGDTSGPSGSTLKEPIQPGDHDEDACLQVRLDAVLPPGTVAIQPTVRLVAPEGDLLAAHLAVDDVRLIEWAPPGSAGRRYDTVEGSADGDADFTVVGDPGVEQEGEPLAK